MSIPELEAAAMAAPVRACLPTSTPPPPTTPPPTNQRHPPHRCLPTTMSKWHLSPPPPNTYRCRCQLRLRHSCYGINLPPGRDGQDTPQSTAHWKADDVSYFTPDLASDAHVRTNRGTTYYMNVYAFINQLKALVPLKSEEVVRANLPSCLREAAARWYSAELSDEERQDLSVRSLQLGWYATLEKRFKPHATSVLRNKVWW